MSTTTTSSSADDLIPSAPRVSAYLSIKTGYNAKNPSTSQLPTSNTDSSIQICLQTILTTTSTSTDATSKPWNIYMISEHDWEKWRRRRTSRVSRQRLYGTRCGTRLWKTCWAGLKLCLRSLAVSRLPFGEPGTALRRTAMVERKCVVVLDLVGFLGATSTEMDLS